MTQLECQCCGRRLTASKAAARVIGNGWQKAWCFDCWDNDLVALDQYLMAQTAVLRLERMTKALNP